MLRMLGQRLWRPATTAVHRIVRNETAKAGPLFDAVLHVDGYDADLQECFSKQGIVIVKADPAALHPVSGEPAHHVHVQGTSQALLGALQFPGVRLRPKSE